jgi:hypothetical protein
MWGPRFLTILWASTACYRDSFIFIFSLRHKLNFQKVANKVVPMFNQLSIMPWWRMGLVDVYTHACLTSAVFESEWSASRPGHFTPGERSPVPIWYEAGWATEPLWMTWKSDNSCFHRLQLRGRPACSQWLYRLRHHGSQKAVYGLIKT